MAYEEALVTLPQQDATSEMARVARAAPEEQIKFCACSQGARLAAVHDVTGAGGEACLG